MRQNLELSSALQVIEISTSEIWLLRYCGFCYSIFILGFLYVAMSYFQTFIALFDVYNFKEFVCVYIVIVTVHVFYKFWISLTLIFCFKMSSKEFKI